jgi:hypothetical protein
MLRTRSIGHALRRGMVRSEGKRQQRSHDVVIVTRTSTPGRGGRGQEEPDERAERGVAGAQLQEPRGMKLMNTPAKNVAAGMRRATIINQALA